MPSTDNFQYYIYAYLRDNGIPYYIGKGSGKRAWDVKAHNIRPPKDTSKIVIMEKDLSETGALALERFYIRWYGRMDLSNRGVLRNMTDGGDGSNPSQDVRQKIRDARKKQIITDETRQKLRQYMIENPINYWQGKHLSREHKQKLSNYVSKTRWYNNGQIAKRFIEGQQPVDFSLGRMKVSW